MTICVAAIAEVTNETPRIVFCADRLVSGAVQFEHGNTKIFLVAENCLVMMAGDPLKGSIIIAKVKEYLDHNQTKIEGIAKLISSEYQSLSNEINEQKILSPRKLTIKEFYSNIANYPDWLSRSVDNQLQEDPFQLEFLIIGIENNQTHLYQIAEKGEINSFSSLGFVAIGSGAPQSIAELGKYQYGSNISLSQAIHLTYLAKKEAERVGTVGKETDLGVMHVVDKKVTLWFADKDFLGMLDNQILKLKGYEKQLQKETENAINRRIYPNQPSEEKESKHEPQ